MKWGLAVQQAAPGIRDYVVIEAHEDNRLAYALLKLVNDATHHELDQPGAYWWQRELTVAHTNTMMSSGDREVITDLFELRDAIAASALIRDFPALLTCELLAVPPEALDDLVRRGDDWAAAQAEQEAFQSLVNASFRPEPARKGEQPSRAQRAPPQGLGLS